MSTTSVGKQKEREVCKSLKREGFKAVRVPGSGNRAGGLSCDIVAVHPSRTDELDETSSLSRVADHFGEWTRGTDYYYIEVKYEATGPPGLKTILQAHLETVGVGDVVCVLWPSGVRTGGSLSFRVHQTRYAERWELEDATLPLSVRRLLEGEGDKLAPDVVALRGSGQKLLTSEWVYVWR